MKKDTQAAKNINQKTLKPIFSASNFFEDSIDNSKNNMPN